MGEHDEDWDQYLDLILFGIRTSIHVHASTKHTPFFLMHGREARLPMEVEKAEAVLGINPLSELDRRIDQLSNLKDEIFPVVKANIDKAQVKQKEQYRRRRGLDKQDIKVGDTVMRLNMLKRTKKGNKTQDTWVGTYKVVEITKYGACRLQFMASNTILKRKINLAQLKLYRQQDETGEQLSVQAESESPNQATDQDESDSPNQPTDQAESDSPNQPTDQARSGSPNQPTDRAQPTDQAGDGSPNQPSDSGPDHPADQVEDGCTSDEDERIILEKELLNENLFRLIQYESSFFRDAIVKGDEKLDVSIA